MPPVITHEKLIATFVGQARSTDLWLAIWDKNKAFENAKNALTALGKLGGQYGMLLAAYGDENLPEEIITLHQKYSERWQEIMRHDFYKVF